MAVRLGQGLNIGGMMSGNAAAADLLVEAGRAKGAGLAAIGQGLGQGLATFGANRRADKIRAEENAFRQQSRDDMLAERAADNARQDRQVGMRETEWKASVLGNLAQQYASEADMLDQAAAASGDPSLLAKAQAKRGDAARYRTALEALVSGKGSGVPDMPAPERTQPIGMYDSRVYTPPNAPATDGGGGGMDGAVTRIVDEAFAGGPGFFGPKGSYPAPEPVAPKAKPEASEAAFGVKYTGSPAADIKLANLVLRNVTALRQSGKWGLLSPELQNVYARAEIDANVKLGESQFGLKKQEMAFQNQMQAEDEARKAARDASELADINARRQKNGQPPLASLREVGPQMTTERTVDNREDTQKHQKEMAQIRNTYSLGRMAQSEETKKRLIAYAASVGKADDPRFKMLATMRDDANSSARSLYAAADNDSLNKAASQALMDRADAEMARVKEFDKQIAMVFGDVAARVAPAAGAAPQAAASVEFPSWITEDFKERWKAMPQSERDKAIKARGK